MILLLLKLLLLKLLLRDTALGSVTSLLSTIGIGLGGRGDQILQGIEEQGLVVGVPGAEAGIELAGAEASS